VAGVVARQRRRANRGDGGQAFENYVQGEIPFEIESLLGAGAGSVPLFQELIDGSCPQ